MHALRPGKQKSACGGAGLPEAARVGWSEEGVPGAQAVEVLVQGMWEDLFGAAPRDQASGSNDGPGTGAAFSRSVSQQLFGRSQGRGTSYLALRRVLETWVPLAADPMILLPPEDGIYLGIDAHSLRGNNLVITVACLRPVRMLLVILPGEGGITAHPGGHGQVPRQEMPRGAWTRPEG